MQKLSRRVSAKWCADICRGRAAHATLATLSEQFDAHLNEKAEFDLDAAETKLIDLSKQLENVECERLYALVIDVLRHSAFIEVVDEREFMKRCYHLIINTWETRREAEQRRQIPPVDQIFSTEQFLEGWISDLPRVNPQHLASYVTVLGCNGLSSSMNRFSRAIEEFRKRLLSQEMEEKQDIIDECGVRLIQSVLKPLKDKNRRLFLKSLPAAAEIAATAALGCQTNSLENLAVFVISDVKPPRYKRDGSVYKADRDKYEAYAKFTPILSRVFLATRRDQNNDSATILSDMIPKLSPWNRDRRRKAYAGLRMTLQVWGEESAEYREFSGQVIDLVKDWDVDKPYYHVHFDDFIDSAPVKGSEKPIPGEDGVESVLLWVNDEANEFTFRKGLATIHVPEDCPGFQQPEVQTPVLPVRAWKSKNPGSKGIGVVFWLECPPNIDVGPFEVVLVHESRAEPTAEAKEVPLVESSIRQFRRGDRELLEDIVRWFEELGNTLRFDKRWRGLYTTVAGKGPIPVDEESIDGQFRTSFKNFIELHGGTLHCQEDAGWGPLDYLVQHGEHCVVVELKRSEAKLNVIKRSMEVQLPTYMQGKNTSFGLFCLFDFRNQFKDGSEKLKELLKIRDKVCRKKKICVDLVIIRCDKPTSASKRRKAPDEKGGFQYWKCRQRLGANG